MPTTVSPAKHKMEAVMYLMAKKQFHILEVEALAKVLGSELVHTFDLVGPKGRKHCVWIDPHYGIFEMQGVDESKPSCGAFNVNQFQFVADIHCENIEGGRE